MTEDLEEIQKSSITISPPGMPLRFGVLTGAQAVAGAYGVVNGDKKFLYQTYEDMYVQHPYVRAVIEKLARYCVTSGYGFVPFENDQPKNEVNVKKLNRFFRRSMAGQLLRATYRDLMIFGEAFWFIERNLLNSPRRALRLHPMYTVPVVEDGEVTKYRYGSGASAPSGVQDTIEYKTFQIVHFRVPNPSSDIMGLSPLASLTRTVAADISAMEFNGNFFENSAQTGIVFSMENSTADEAKRNREYLEQNYVGTRNAHRPILLEGTVKVEKSVSTYQEMQFVEGRRMWRQEILSVFDLDERKIGINEGPSGDQKNEDDAFHTEAIAGWHALVEETINDDLIVAMFSIEDTLFKANERDPRMQLNKMTFYRDAVRDGILVRNDVRGEMGLPPIKGGDIATVQTSTGLLPLDLIEEMGQALLDNQKANQAMIESRSQQGLGAEPKTDTGVTPTSPHSPGNK